MRKRYPTDLSDAEWSYLEPHLPAPEGHGRPRVHDLREILNAVFYLLKSGRQWRLLPTTFPGDVVVGMPEGMLVGNEESADGVLSVRELEILLLAARGLSNEGIASSLHLAEATVKRHLANVYQKMGVHSRGEAAREALLREWITIEEVTSEDEGG